MSKKVVLLLFVSLVVLCQNIDSPLAEKAFRRPFRSIKLISPNGGETWNADSTYDITWRSRGWIQFVKIEYSTDSDSSWNFITRRTRNDGTYSWEVPNTPSDYCKVRVSALFGLISDESNSVFSIVSDSSLPDSAPPDSSYITVTDPNGGELWYAGIANYITWDSYNTSGAVKIEYTLNAYDSVGGDSTPDWITITDDTVDAGSFVWYTPSDISSYYCLIKVSDVDGSLSDMSDYPFSILPLDSVPSDSVPPDSVPPDSIPYITVTRPNGGEIWHADTVNYIIWDSYNTSGAVRIEYTLNAYDSAGGDSISDWITITDDTVDVGSFVWFTPSDISSDNCLIKVSDVDGSLSDMSDYPFSILPLDSVPSDSVPPDSVPPDSVPPDSITSDSLPQDSFSISSSAARLPSAYSMDVKSINSSSKLVINYGIPKEASIKLVVYDILGARIKEISEEKSAGFYSTTLDLESKPGGIYFVRIQANGKEFAKTSKVLLLK